MCCTTGVDKSSIPWYTAGVQRHPHHPFALVCDMTRCQVRRGKGDNLEFSKFCKELMETKLTDVVHKTTMDNVGEPVAAA